MSPQPDVPRLLKGLPNDGKPLSLAEHRVEHGPLAARIGRQKPDHTLIDWVDQAGLTGRGGAGFPTARKLAAVAAERGRRVVVANGAEGEPSSGKDRFLLRHAPHLVLDGAVVAAQAVGADTVIVATTAAAAEPVRCAIEERAAKASGQAEVLVRVVPERFIAGQETALVSFLNGGPGVPTFVPPRPDQRGVKGRPTLVQNVETLAHLALIARHGPGWFRTVGTPSEPGSTLVTVIGTVGRPGVYEIPRGTRLRHLVAQAGGPTARLQAFLVGGYAGAWVPASDAWEAQLSDRSLAAYGGLLASGVILAFPESSCGIAETARILAYLADESAGQCGPCLHGLATIARAAMELARGVARGDVVERLQDWAWQITGRGACHHPDGATRLLGSALRTFAADAGDHRRHRPCRAAPLARPTRGEPWAAAVKW